MATYNIPKGEQDPEMVPSRRSTKPIKPPTFKPTPLKKSIPEDTQDPFRKNALRKKLSPHQQHMAHMNHVNHVNHMRNKNK